MKPRPFITLMVVLALLLVMVSYAIWETVTQHPDAASSPHVLTRDEIDAVTSVDLPEGISWQAPGIEVGTLHYTITRVSVLTNLNHLGIGSIRESATMGIYDEEGNLTLYYYPECVDEYGDLVEGGNFVVLDITVTSQDAVNFITKGGVQQRRYADNPFLFRADEIAYLIDITEEADDGYTYYDAVFFTEMGYHGEHEMAYEVLPGESISFRIGYLLGNRPDGSPRDPKDLVMTTNWGKAEKEFYDLGLS